MRKKPVITDSVSDLLVEVLFARDPKACDQLWQVLTGRLLPTPSEDTGRSTARAGRAQ